VHESADGYVVGGHRASAWRDAKGDAFAQIVPMAVARGIVGTPGHRDGSARCRLYLATDHGLVTGTRSGRGREIQQLTTRPTKK
jgi:hypothetical protein